MESLTLELSKMLNITVEKAVELYPMIQQQFIQYKIFSTLSGIVFIGVLISVIMLTWMGFSILMYGGTKLSIFNSMCMMDEIETAKEYKEKIKYPIISTIFFVILMSILSLIPYIIAPEFMMLKEFIIK